MLKLKERRNPNRNLIDFYSSISKHYHRTKKIKKSDVGHQILREI